MGKLKQIQNLHYTEHVQNGLSYKEIQEKYNITRGIWNYYCQKLNLECDLRKHRPNDNYFDVLDTYNKNYILGFLYADGCITEDNRISILLHERDIAVLEFIKSELCPFIEIKKLNYTNFKRSPQVLLRFKSKKLVDTLKNLDFFVKKTSTDSNIFSYIPTEWKKAFIIGYTDGDGCIRFSKNKCNTFRISISWVNGSKKLLDDLNLYFYKQLGFLGILDTRKNVSFYFTLSYNKKEYTSKIFKFLYSKSESDFILPRKKIKVKDILKYLNNTEVK